MQASLSGPDDCRRNECHYGTVLKTVSCVDNSNAWAPDTHRGQGAIVERGAALKGADVNLRICVFGGAAAGA